MVKDNMFLFKGTFQRIDMFSFGINFRQKNKEKLSTWTGTILSLLIVTLVGYYSNFRL